MDASPHLEKIGRGRRVPRLIRPGGGLRDVRDDDMIRIGHEGAVVDREEAALRVNERDHGDRPVGRNRSDGIVRTDASSPGCALSNHMFTREIGRMTGSPINTRYPHLLLLNLGTGI